MHGNITDKRRVVKAPERERHLKPEAFIDLNKNFMNFLEARDTRVKLHRVKDAKTGRSLTPLPGEDRITLRFAKGAVRRCATAFELNVRLLLQAEVRKQGQTTITLPSLSVILKQLGLSCGTVNLRRARAAFELLSCLSIHFLEYRDHAGGKGRKSFPPPITKLNIRRGGPITITLHEDWIEWKCKYFKRLPLPLPMQAAAFNTVLYTSAYEGKPLKVKVRTFCRKIGIVHNNRRLTLPHAIEQAMEWYREHGGSLEYVIDGKFITLTSSPGQHPVKQETSQRAPRPANKPVERVKREKPPERVKLERIERVKQVEVFDDDDEGLDQYGMLIHGR
jgi:hypothetical protein